MQNSALSVCPSPRSLLWEPLAESDVPTRRPVWRVPLLGRAGNDTADSRERRRPKQREPADYPLRRDGLSRSNESKSNERQITTLQLSFSSSVISAQSLCLAHHNGDVSPRNHEEILFSCIALFWKKSAHSDLFPGSSKVFSPTFPQKVITFLSASRLSAGWAATWSLSVTLMSLFFFSPPTPQGV